MGMFQARVAFLAWFHRDVDSFERVIVNGHLAILTKPCHAPTMSFTLGKELKVY